MASDVTRPGDFKVGTNTYVAVETDGADEADRVFTGLADGGSVEMPLQKVEWAEKFGICADRFGVQWMVSHTGDVSSGRAERRRGAGDRGRPRYPAGAASAASFSTAASPCEESVMRALGRRRRLY